MIKVYPKIKKVIWNKKFGSDRDVREKVYRPLNRAGALIRGFAKRSMRYRKSARLASVPGQPPRAHVSSNQGLRQITFDVDKRNMDVMVGPWWLSTRGKKGNNNYIVSEMQEYGGSGDGLIKVATHDTYWSRTLHAHIYKTRMVKGRMRFKPRPYMRPALQATKNKFPGLFREIYKNR